MNRDEALRLLRGGRKGVTEWNVRRAGRERIPSLRNINLEAARLAGIDLRNANLKGANLFGADLRPAMIRSRGFESDLSYADLSGADLRAVNLAGVNLTRATLTDARLNGSILLVTNFFEADLRGADLSGTVLLGTNLAGAEFANTKLHSAFLEQTTLPSDLSQAQGLDLVRYIGPSFVNVDALRSFKDDLPESFLRGCGLGNEEIAFFRSRVGMAIRFYTCFISYSSQDEAFATRLHNDFQAAGIRCWKWDHDARTGRSLWGEIDTAIRKYDKLVLVASEHSLRSPAVNREIERALQQEDHRLRRKLDGEKDADPDVLFPVRIDDYIFEKWEHERKADVIKKVVADARGWERDNGAYERVLQKLVRDLKPGEGLALGQ